MKWLIALAISARALFGASCSSTDLSNGITCIVSASAGSTSASSGATTGSTTTTGATLLVAVVVSYVSGSGLTISDSKSNTWTALTTYSTSTQENITLYYAQNPTVGTSHTVSCAGTSVYCSVAFAALSGLATSGVFNSGTDSGAHGDSNSTLATGSITPPSGVQLIVSGESGGTDNVLPSPDNSLTVYEHVAGASGQHWQVALAMKTQATGAAINVTWTDSTGTTMAVDIASFNTGAAPATAITRRWYGQGR